VSQPASTDTCNDMPSRVSLSCSYGNVTCSCEERSTNNPWKCGVCPALEPRTGDLCGNVPAGDCRFGDDTCRCGSDGKWTCAQAGCPMNFVSNGFVKFCPTPSGAYTCRYAAEDQDCICAPDQPPGSMAYRCSCPANLPAEGGPCLVGAAGACVYGDVSCSCASGSVWHCMSTKPPDPCPQAQPSAGDPCLVRVSTCVYGSAICACNGSTWSCS
jgi:hypothetical protein